MQTARGLATARQGHVNGLGRQFGGQFGLFKQRLARIENLCDTLLATLMRHRLADALLLAIAQGLHHLSQFTLFAKVLNPDLLQGIDIFSALHSL
ncbi:Uncharacterised protein [Pseudomonas fragi]|uniref:Uncharacterized protein n=1 Tax=Pseudomonas fragi TaxID=296 RepID=A0A449ISN0_PSEFR|nr:Uncharacterised protein [Pseudomonas fragi]